MTYTTRVALANSVPAAAVIQKGRALSELIGRKTHVGGLHSYKAVYQQVE